MANERDVLQARERTEFGKGAARRMRQEGLLPAVVYGQGEAAHHITLDYHTAWLTIRGNPNALLTLKMDGEDQLALVKDRQINPLTRRFEHLDLLRVKADQKVEVDVTVEVSGEPYDKAVATVELMTILVEAPVNAIPESIVVDVEGVEDGTYIRIGDLTLPEGVTTELDPEEPVVIVAEPQEVELPEPEEGEEGEAAEGEEGEAAEGEEGEAAEGEDEE